MSHTYIPLPVLSRDEFYKNKMSNWYGMARRAGLTPTPYYATVDSEMAVADIQLGPLRGRKSVPLEVSFAGEIVESDLTLLASERGTRAPGIAKLRDRHHALARALASGMGYAEAASVTGYDYSRVAVLATQDPTFRKLVAEYREIKDAAFADFQDLAAAAAREAVTLVHDKLEADPDSVSIETGLEVIRTLADRTGNGPMAKSFNVNASVNIGDRLGRARERVKAAKALEATVLPVTSDAE